MSYSLSFLWGHTVHVAKFPMLHFYKSYCPHSFDKISTKPYGHHGNKGEMAITFLGDVPNL